MNQLLQTVIDSGYNQFYQFFGDANLRFRDWEMAAGTMQGAGRTLVDVFLLQERVGRKKLGALIGTETVDELLALDVLKRDGQGVRSNDFFLLQVRDQIYFAQICETPYAYFGEDSLALAYYQSPIPDAAVLDLCSGPGIQSLVASRRAKRVTAVERNPKAAAVAELNVRLNNREKLVTVVNASLEDFGAKDRKKYDQILFNPPLVPVPGEMDYHPAGHGGVVGLDVIDRILGDFQKNLRPGGRFEFIGMTMRRTPEPPEAEPLRRLISDHKLSGRLHVVSRHQMNRNSIVLNTVVNSLALSNGIDMETAMDETLDFYEKAGYDEFYLYFCSLGIPDKGPPALRVVDMAASHFGGWFS